MGEGAPLAARDCPARFGAGESLILYGWRRIGISITPLFLGSGTVAGATVPPISRYFAFITEGGVANATRRFCLGRGATIRI